MKQSSDRTEGALWALERASMECANVRAKMDYFNALNQHLAQDVAQRMVDLINALAARVRSGEVEVPERGQESVFSEEWLKTTVPEQNAANIVQVLPLAPQPRTVTTSTAAPAQSETPNYKALWERDSSALGRCLQDIHNLRAIKEDQRAKIVGLERELSALRAEQQAAKTATKEPR